MNSKIEFNCSRCGECCGHIDKVPQLAQFDIGNGTCIHLHDNLCSIYLSRPEVCRVDTMYEKYYSNQYTRDEFYRLNEDACTQLKAK